MGFPMTPSVGIIIYQSGVKIHRPLWCAGMSHLECHPERHALRPYDRLFPLRYNGLVSDVKPFRLTESVKAAG